MVAKFSYCIRDPCLAPMKYFQNGLINRAGSIAKMLRKSSSSSILETLMDGNSVDSDQVRMKTNSFIREVQMGTV